jgi:hypothetical protein
MTPAAEAALAIRRAAMQLLREADRTLDPLGRDLSVFMANVWKRGGRQLCNHCGRPIYRDHGSGYYIHAGHAAVDGRNGLYCESAMWDDPSIRTYATPLKAEEHE